MRRHVGAKQNVPCFSAQRNRSRRFRGIVPTGSVIATGHDKNEHGASYVRFSPPRRHDGCPEHFEFSPAERRREPRQHGFQYGRLRICNLNRTRDSASSPTKKSSMVTITSKKLSGKKSGQA